MPLKQLRNRSQAANRARFLEIWCDGLFRGAVRLRPSSVAARAILKFFDPRLNAEFRDPINYETYRYDQSKDSLFIVSDE
jgi:hypothetical protein